MEGVVAVIALVFSGLGLAGLMPDPVTSLLGGHVWFDTMHRLFGLIFSAALMLVSLLVPARTRGLLSDVSGFRRSEVRWPLAFLRFSFHPRQSRPPHHDGRFDPVQRVVFLGLGGSLILLVGSGIVLYFASPYARLILVWAVRVHVFATVVLIVCVCIHILAGSGLLPTHRGVARSMFGNGRVRLSLARRLWPGWARRQATDSNFAPDPASEVGDSGQQVSSPPLSEPR
jgi:cytochrome b subunit of formate dehydrogenase